MRKSRRGHMMIAVRAETVLLSNQRSEKASQEEKLFLYTSHENPVYITSKIIPMYTS